MHADARSLVHPSFTEVLRQINVDEAAILRWISNARRERFGIIRVWIRGTLDHGQVELGFETSALPPDGDLRQPTLTSSYVANLERLGIISIAFDHRLTDKRAYEELDPLADAFAARVAPGVDVLRKERGIVRVTPFGQLFLLVVVRGIETAAEETPT
jgi:hypothetical protein